MKKKKKQDTEGRFHCVRLDFTDREYPNVWHGKVNSVGGCYTTKALIRG